MDSSNFKIPKRQPINFKPKLQPKNQVQLNNFKKTQAKTVASFKPVNPVNPVNPVAPNTRPNYIDSISKDLVVKPQAKHQDSKSYVKKHKKQKKLVGVMAVSFLLFALTGVGYYVYTKKIAKPSDSTASNINKAEQNTNQTTTLIYQPKEGSMFETKSVYNDDPQSQVVTAESTLSGDNRELAISQQVVSANYTEDPEGLIKLLQKMGEYSKQPIKDGESYIITGNIAATTIKDDTLIIVRSTGALTIEEWIELFNSLEKK